MKQFSSQKQCGGLLAKVVIQLRESDTVAELVITSPSKEPIRYKDVQFKLYSEGGKLCRVKQLTDHEHLMEFGGTFRAAHAFYLITDETIGKLAFAQVEIHDRVAQFELTDSDPDAKLSFQRSPSRSRVLLAILLACLFSLSSFSLAEEGAWIPIASYAPGDAIAAKKIRDTLSTHRIRYTIIQSYSASVSVDTKDVKKAKSLIMEVASEGHPSVMTLTAENGRAKVDKPQVLPRVRR